MKLRNLRSRPLYPAILSVILAMVLLWRLYDLQILRGEELSASFEESVKRTVSIPAKRGRILDRNGIVIADSVLKRNVTIVDTTGNTSEENDRLNSIILKTLQILRENGSDLTEDFGIGWDGSDYVFALDGWDHLRFLADLYGYPSTDTLTEEEKEASAEDIVLMLAQRYRVSEDMNTPEQGDLLLGTVAVRYHLSLNAYQKYIPTVIAKDVGKSVVEAVMAQTDLDGVGIAGEYERIYKDSLYLSDVTGYTSLISSEELEENSGLYDAGDHVGKVGIEASMEEVLRGKNGSREITVDNLGREQRELSFVRPTEGNDVCLTIDSTLQKNIYKILEKNMRDILLSRITDKITSFTITQETDGSEILIPAADVYGSLLSYKIDRDRFYAEDASESERQVLEILENGLQEKKEAIYNELTELRTPFGELTSEYQQYMTYISRALFDRGVIDTSLTDEDDDIYSGWTAGSSVSLGDFLYHAAKEGWIDTEVLGCSSEDADAIFQALADYVLDEPCEDYSFGNIVCKFLAEEEKISGELVCRVLFDQGIYSPSDSERESIESEKKGAAYDYVVRLLKSGTLTPGELYLYPFSGSVVVTDPSDGTVLAMVSYPGYDCNRLQSSEYMDEIKRNPARPMLNHATQQRTAPGSTFKMVTAAAGIGEGVIDTKETVDCYDLFDKIEPSPACWIYPGGHGWQNLQSAIANSCNSYFYEVGYRLGETGGEFDNETGIGRLSEYASLFGLDRTSGAEIEEAEPSVATRDVVRASIGQSNNGYTTAALARYIGAVASEGKVYDLTLLDHTQDKDGNILQVYPSKPAGTIDIGEDYWNSIREGMRRVCTSKLGFSSLARKAEDGSSETIHAAGKTGTAQQGVNTPNHALFLGYAPLEEPEIAVAVRIPNGYSSSYAALVAAEVMQYYFDPGSLSGILTSDTIPNYENGD